MVQRSSDEKRQLLNRIPLFAQLGRGDIEILLGLLTAVEFPARHELFHKGDPAHHVYVIANGRVKVCATSTEGKEIVFTILGPNEVFGETALVLDCERTASVVTLEPTELFMVDRRAFLPVLERNAPLAVQLLKEAFWRLRRISQQVEDTVFLPLPSRLAKKLLGLAQVYGQNDPKGIRIDLALSQQDLGQMVGTSRESINKQIRTWEEHGLLTMERGSVVIHSQTGMESLASVPPL